MKKEQIIFLDFDGTIVDYHNRFYKIYRDAYIEIGEVPLSKKEWLKMRRNGGVHYPPGIHEKIEPHFARTFESSEYLKYDTLIPGMLDVVHTLQEKYPVKIVSFRGNNETLLEQLDYLGIHNVETIIQGFRPGIAIDEKANMIRKVISDPKGFIIGDTSYEILAGKVLGLTTIACTWGDQSSSTLRKHKPDFVVDKPEEILEIINLVN
jgi:phosphoglycolate phosphatase